jgi:polysaccharide pyruvyl transferase WcaK-like protein
MFPNSVGPFRTFVGRLLAKNAFKQLDLMLIRDRMSLSTVEALGVKLPIKSTVDVAINFRSDAQNVQGISEGRTIGVAAGTYLNALGRNEFENYVTAHAKALDYMIQKYNVEVVFLPHDITGFKGDDYHVSKCILEEMQNKNHAKMICVDNVDEYKSAVEQVEILVSSKMHPAVLASSSGVPAMYIVYDHKQTGFFEHLGFSELCLNIKSVSYSSLVRKMETLWNDRKNLSESLKQSVPVLQQNVKDSIRNALLSLRDSESSFTKRARDDDGDSKRSR